MSKKRTRKLQVKQQQKEIIQIQLIKRKSLQTNKIINMQKQTLQLFNILQDINFAWELLNAEIQIQMSNIASGEVIATLLQLYMRGVEKMNSLGDPRESYFKNKVTSLMTKQTVIKSLKQNPMKKKSKPDEVPAKPEKKPKKPTTQQGTKVQVKIQINQLELKQKRRQLQMRMAYVAEQHGPENLKKIIAQQDHRQQNISSKINKILNSHEQRLNERIKARKLRTATFRSRSQVHTQESPSVQLNEYQKFEQKKQEQFLFPLQKLIKNSITKRQQSKQKAKQELRKAMRKKHRSLSQQRSMQSPQKGDRKYTRNQINPKKSFS